VALLRLWLLELRPCKWGTAYLLCPEAKVSPLYREALKNAMNGQTTLTNIFTDRPPDES
jgi:NAD(P)H-dependent flavin oxidoreductase YrpB (nitropropane dioxygenase family)